MSIFIASNTFHSPCRLAAVLPLFLTAFIVIMPQAAGAAGLSRAYLVANVPVDGTGDSGVAAREAARADGEIRAFTILLKRLTLTTDWDRLPHLPAARVTDYVLDMVVDDEHISANRYIGVYSYRFSPKGVSRLLHDAGLTVWDTPSKPVVPLPVLQINNTSVLWEDPNPWREAWRNATVRAGLVPWFISHGDAQDVQAIDAAATTANPVLPDKLSAFSQRYNGADPMIAVAAETDQPDGSTLQITVTRYTPTGPETGTTSVSAPKPDKTLYAAGVEATEVVLESLWKDEQQKSPVSPSGTPNAGPAGDGNAQTLIVSTSVSGPREWVRLKNRLGQVSGIQDVKILAMTSNALTLSLKLAGSVDSLRGSFQQQNIVISQGDQGSVLTMQPGPLPVSP